ncbi:hypothetical protein HPT29_004585 [Microvirga terrae]|uniref:LamG domain-containing protein n=1 Tax=Microvirga terrae TaxID=2740529 RepID=A0ABY5RT39_9HYPH|nr:hypothetical protein [Microvirga terrae]UVF20430.1 hypothetical protein HPT29_004585 [Microvirga terrae]
MASETYLTHPLTTGRTVGHWQLGDVHEERYDVPDRTMKGKMDAFFFLTKDRNFIPHQYACRTDFIEAYRGKTPQPVTHFAPTRVWLPFGSPRVDLSGFWFRATRVECWARTTIESPRDQTARFSFATCGGAFLEVNGRRVAELARYQRNFEERVEIDIALKTGRNELRVWFADLCERDARYYFSLELVSGEGLSVGLPIAVDEARAAAVESMLEGMRFERPSYGRGEVAIVFDHAATYPLDVRVAVRGDFMSTEDTLAFDKALPAGAARIAIADTSELPADFRHFDITLRDGSFAATRVLGVEICHLDRQPPASPDIGVRARAVLDHVSERGERDMVAVLARLALDRGGPDTDRIIESCLPIVGDCHDCADFLLVPLLWSRMAWPERIASDTRAGMDDVILRFRYWMDEPGNDVMWYFSENHALLFHTACHLAGSLFPDATFTRSGRRGREQAEIGRQRLVEWLTHFEACEMAEWNSAPYFPIDLKGLCALYALSPDAGIRERSGAAIRRLLEIMALSSHHGMMTASQGRSYEHTLRPGRTLELSGISYLAFGQGSLGRRFHAVPQLALCFAEHGLTIDPRLAAFSDHRSAGAYEWRYKQGENGIASLYHFKSKDYALGSIAAYRWGEWGYQETVLHLRLGETPEAQIWINHPGEVIHSGYGRPSYWGGCGTVPRVHQFRSLALVDFAAHPAQPDFTHAWLPEAEMDEVIHLGNRILVRSGEGLCLIVASGPLERVATGPTAGCEVRLPGYAGRWIVRLSDIATEASLAAFGERFANLSAEERSDGVILVQDPDFGPVGCHPDGAVKTPKETIDPKTWTLSGTLTVFPEGAHVPLPSQQTKQEQREIA